MCKSVSKSDSDTKILLFMTPEVRREMELGAFLLVRMEKWRHLSVDPVGIACHLRGSSLASDSEFR